MLFVSATPPEPTIVRVRLVTSVGDMSLALDARRAPRTVANFMAYVDDGRLDGTRFYRAARRVGDPRFGFVQGGVGTDARRMLAPLKLEPTSRTGLSHSDATLSMAHGDNPDSANGNFSIMIGDNRALDARAGSPGYAAFGRVTAGMDVARRILAMPTTEGGRGTMRGQMLAKPVAILRAERLNGVAKPTGQAKPWLIKLPWRKE